MPSPREIAEKTSRPGFIQDKAEQVVKQNEQRVPERDYRADPVNPPEKPAPAKNLKEG